jgi:2-hydroxyglutarate dehydrogenase
MGVTTQKASARPFRLGFPGRPPNECDLVVIGGGLIGLAVARELLRRHEDASVTVLEREPQLAMHQSGSSSGVIHAGIYYEPGSLKARLCVEGARELYEYCEEHSVPVQRNGKLIVATTPQELERLDELERRGRANGVPGLARLGADEIPEIEPAARGLAALHSPATGVVNFRRVAAALAADVRAAGGTVVTGCGVRAVLPVRDALTIAHERGVTRARAVVACAGLWSDRLADGTEAARDVRIVPFRGAYLRLHPERASLVRGNIYPVPDPALPFLGAHLTRTHANEVLLGPTALLALSRHTSAPLRPGPDTVETLSWPGTWRLARRHWRAGLRELKHALWAGALVAEAQRMVPQLQTRDFERGTYGVRAQALGRDGALVDDFLIRRGERALHVLNAPSPAATSCLALARLIADDAEGLLD